MPEIVEQAKDNSRKSGGTFEMLDDFDAGFKDADIVYPKSWGCWLTTEDKDESREDRQEVHRLDHRRAPHGAGAASTPSTCTACPPTATSK